MPLQNTNVRGHICHLSATAACSGYTWYMPMVHVDNYLWDFVIVVNAHWMLPDI
jgi:hypothetical protein